MTLYKSGYTKSTPNYYWTDAGAVYKNLKYDAGTKMWEGKLLGATADGNKVTISQEYRVIKVDGVFTKAIGQSVLESANASIEINVKEITAENIRLSINGVVRDATGEEAPEGYKIIEGKSKLDSDDYFENIALVGTMTGSNEPIIIILDNPLCTSGFEADTKDNEEAVIKMTFEAHAAVDQVADRKLPARILFPPIFNVNPPELILEELTPTEVNLSWSIIDGVNNYEIKRIEAMENEVITSVVIQGASHKDTSVEQGKEYKYYLRTIDNDGLTATSIYSNEIKVLIPNSETRSAKKSGVK